MSLKSDMKHEKFFRDAWEGELSTEQGEEWYPRLEGAEKYHEANSLDWGELRALLADLENFAEEVGAESNGIYVSIAWAVVQNLISDVYFKNPDRLAYVRRRT